MGHGAGAAQNAGRTTASTFRCGHCGHRVYYTHTLNTRYFCPNSECGVPMSVNAEKAVETIVVKLKSMFLDNLELVVDIVRRTQHWAEQDGAGILGTRIEEAERRARTAANRIKALFDGIGEEEQPEEEKAQLRQYRQEQAAGKADVSRPKAAQAVQVQPVTPEQVRAELSRLLLRRMAELFNVKEETMTPTSMSDGERPNGQNARDQTPPMATDDPHPLSKEKDRIVDAIARIVARSLSRKKPQLAHWQDARKGGRSMSYHESGRCSSFFWPSAPSYTSR